MVLLVLAVGVRMFIVRVGEFKAKRIRPQDAATSLQVAQKLQAVQASDNFRNLFEVPVLFYVWCALVIATQQANLYFAVGAWAFVVLRVGHSFIQCTYNKVMHRFACFATSSLILLLLWCALAIGSVQ